MRRPKRLLTNRSFTFRQAVTDQENPGKVNFHKVNELVAEKILKLGPVSDPRIGLEWRWVDYRTGHKYTDETLPKFSTDIAAAWMIVSTRHHKLKTELTQRGHARDDWYCIVSTYNYASGYAIEKDPALAICLAALQAVGVEVHE